MGREYVLQRKQATSGNIVVAADGDESIEILDIGYKGGANSSYVDVNIEGKVMNRFQIGDNSLNMLPGLFSAVVRPPLLSWLAKNSPIPIPTYKLGANQKLTLVPSSTYTRGTVHYQIYAPGDIKQEMDGGFLGKKRLFISYGTNSAAVSADGWTKIDKAANPAGLYNFPYSELVPAKMAFHIIGIGVVPMTVTTSVTRDTIFRKDGDLVFSKDKDGFRTHYGAENELPIGDDADYRGLYLLKQPIIMTEGMRLQIEQYIDYDDANAYVADTSLVAVVGIQEFL